MIIVNSYFNRSGIAEPAPTEMDQLLEDIVGLMEVSKTERSSRKSTKSKQMEKIKKSKADTIREQVSNLV